MSHNIRNMRQPADPSRPGIWQRGLLLLLAFIFLIPPGALELMAANPRRERKPLTNPVTEETRQTAPNDSSVYLDAELAVQVHADSDSIPPTVVTADDYAFDENGRLPFNPSPTRAVWLSALFPGLGQIYNRRYWKLPIVVGGFMGLGYATNWNAGQYNDYMQGYRDLMDSDPGTKSYMNFFPPTVTEDDLDHAWLERTFKYRKDFYRRNRDLCIICLVALYLVCMVDAYVDASMAHFDVSPNLSMDFAPAVITPATGNWKRTALGIQWALTF